jgi:hypothetical protein
MLRRNNCCDIQTVSEVLYWGKKLFVIPIKKQSKQLSNAKVLSETGVSTGNELRANEIAEWLMRANTVQVKFDYDMPNMINVILNAPHTPYRRRKQLNVIVRRNYEASLPVFRLLKTGFESFDFMEAIKKNGCCNAKNR